MSTPMNQYESLSVAGLPDELETVPHHYKIRVAVECEDCEQPLHAPYLAVDTRSLDDIAIKINDEIYQHEVESELIRHQSEED